MRYINLPSIPVPASRLALGSTYFGTTIDKPTAISLLDAFASANGTVIDTARAYGQFEPGEVGLSESIIGQWLTETGMRSHLVLVSKGLFPNPDGSSRFSEENLRKDLEQSLETLQSDTLDIWFFHRDDPQKSVGEIMDMASFVIERGYARRLGASNWTHRRIAEANAYARSKGWPELVASEIQWSLATSTPERWGAHSLVCMDPDAFAWYLETSFPIFAFSAQAKGFFSQAIARGQEGIRTKSKTRFYNGENLKKVERVRELCKQTLLSPAAITLGYVTNRHPYSVAIVGCSNASQLPDSLSGADGRLSPSELAFLEGETYNAT